MRALAIETSGRIGSIALVDEGMVRAEETFPHGLQHAAHIIPIIDRLCRAQGWSPRDVRELYVSAGPGSFTGLRIGITLSKTLAFATGAKIVAVPTHRVLAENAPPEARNLVIVLDAKRDQIFTARFERETSSDQWHEAEPAHLDTLTAMLSRAARPVHLLGEGIPYHEKFIPREDAARLPSALRLRLEESSPKSSVLVTDPQSWRARAAAVAKLGTELARRGEFVDPYRLTPIYIRRPEAEEKADAAATVADR
jgi:tRNA threonylcarbamoyladenosine biosynthesis protein TsaB